MKRNSPNQGDTNTPRRSGPSSYGMQDAGLVFDTIGLKPGHVFLDAGCGPGDYAFRAAELVGPGGKVYAVDTLERMVTGIRQEAERRGLEHLEAHKTDIVQHLPLTESCVDACLIATVLHMFTPNHQGLSLFKEIRRVLRPTGRLAVINCKKEDQPFGPPLSKRWTPEQTAAVALPVGFIQCRYLDLGYNYMVLFNAGGRKS